MIDRKQGLLRYDPVPSDVPPSYDAQESAHSSYQDDKAINPVVRDPSAQSSSSHGKKCSTSSLTKKHICSTTVNLIRDIVQQQSPGPITSSASDIFENISATCLSHGISFSSVLQQKSIADHTPLFWAILMRRSSRKSDDLFATLLSHSTPLTSSTIADMRHACLLTSDNALFQHFKLTPSFSPLSCADQMILGTSICPDTIEVNEDIGSDTGDFIMKFKIFEFRKRMSVSTHVDLEFIARGRMWCLSFAVTRLSSVWFIRLSILKDSPSTWVNSNLIIKKIPPQSSMTPTPGEAPPISAATPSANADEGKPKSDINIPLRTSLGQLSTWGKIESGLENAACSSLQYDGCSYIDAEGSLEGQLEARLVQ